MPCLASVHLASSRHDRGVNNFFHLVSEVSEQKVILRSKPLATLFEHHNLKRGLNRHFEGIKMKYCLN